ncbi:hypothetical protein DYB37_007594 [Aphanomyces astaci]|uniref:HPt domain-containing protein n=1 Tax=Aphanomyces astaci TaxID=112090 RepID=A0A3L6V2U8_APHAT|nr:hypothetical protein DYB35_000547 [Aphanomyces astaci]RHZ21048.1 hypothetical protein DYB37_007594 [Aphanomyces astaci]RLO02968.1 hypothetical protein DYB28_003443 [Aphanomyces astaci]
MRQGSLPPVPSVLVNTSSVMDIEIPDGDPVDYSTGVSQCGGNEDLFLKLLEKYYLGLDAAMHKLEKAHHNQDVAVVRRDAHSLKGSSAYVAAMRVSKAAFRVQVAAEHVQNNKALPDSTATFEASYRQLIQELKALKGYLRRNFQFARPAVNPSSSSSRGPTSDTTPKGAGPCQVM